MDSSTDFVQTKDRSYHALRSLVKNTWTLNNELRSQLTSFYLATTTISELLTNIVSHSDTSGSYRMMIAVKSKTSGSFNVPRYFECIPYRTTLDRLEDLESIKDGRILCSFRSLSDKHNYSNVRDTNIMLFRVDLTEDPIIRTATDALRPVEYLPLPEIVG